MAVPQTPQLTRQRSKYSSSRLRFLRENALFFFSCFCTRVKVSWSMMAGTGIAIHSSRGRISARVLRVFRNVLSVRALSTQRRLL